MEEKGLSLLKRGQRGIARVIFSRSGLILGLLLVNAAITIGVFYWFEQFLPHVVGGNMLITVGMVLYLLSSNMNPTAKITWLILVMVLPVFGALLFWYTQSDVGHRAVKRRLAHLEEQTMGAIRRPEQAQALKEENPAVANLARYMRHCGCHPVYNHTAATYFPSGEAKWEEMLKQLEQAEKFIFLEYFIIDEGMMWGRMLEILARKAAQGVDVRVMYDGTCELTTLPHNYPELMRTLGIRCKMFSPVTPFVSTYYNYRDHRKILVIDGHTAFTGGVNLADEYINQTHRFGHWKDTAIMLKGDAVKSFTLMFLQMWGITERHPEFDRFLRMPAPDCADAKGYVIPYGDSPLDDNKLGERVYMDILNRAQRYVHIMTPYLILDGEMETALKFAAERGVDVRILLPGVPDKKIPYALAKSHFASLLHSGVKIYTYTPGFVHAKVFVSDDREAVVGTINLDYRSLYHHFECAAYLYDTDCIPQIEADFQNTLEQCQQVTMEMVRNDNWLWKLAGILLKAAAPLL